MISKKSLLLVFLTAFISGLSIFLNKYGVSVVNPYVFAFLKNASVALMLGGLVIAIKKKGALASLSKKQWLQLILIGLVGGGAPFLLFFKGLSMTSAAQGAFIHKTMFIYAAVLAWVFLKERISWKFAIGSLLLFLGSLAALKSLPVSFGRGDLLVLAATLLWAAENIISKKTLTDLPGWLVAWGRMSFGSVFIFFFLALTGQLAPVASLGSNQIIWTTIASLLLFGYVLTWYSGLKGLPVSLASAILILGSPITTLFSFLAGNTVGFREVISALAILTGMAFVVASAGFFKNHFRRSFLLRTK